MAQTSYLTFHCNLASLYAHALTTLTAYHPVTTHSREIFVPPIVILDDPMYGDSSNEFDSDCEKHRLPVERYLGFPLPVQRVPAYIPHHGFYLSRAHHRPKISEEREMRSTPSDTVCVNHK